MRFFVQVFDLVDVHFEAVLFGSEEVVGIVVFIGDTEATEGFDFFGKSGLEVVDANAFEL